MSKNTEPSLLRSLHNEETGSSVQKRRGLSFSRSPRGGR